MPGCGALPIFSLERYRGPMPLFARLKHALRPQNRGKFKAPWILANIGYDVIYTIVMIEIFGRYGVVGPVYLVYIAVFSALYAWSTFELVGSLVDADQRRAYRFGALSLISFLAPDIYLIFVTHNVPWTVWAALGAYVCITAVAAAVALRRKVVTRRAKLEEDRVSRV